MSTQEKMKQPNTNNAFGAMFPVDKSNSLVGWRIFTCSASLKYVQSASLTSLVTLGLLMFCHSYAKIPLFSSYHLIHIHQCQSAMSKPSP